MFLLNNNKFVGQTQGEVCQGKLSMSENFPLLSDQFKQKLDLTNVIL
jgi:hypothetical protein